MQTASNSTTDEFAADVRRYLIALGCRPTRVLKQTATTMVVAVTERGQRGVAKVSSDAEFPLIATEWAALEFLTRKRVAGVPRPLRKLPLRRSGGRSLLGLVESYAPGRPLVEYDDKQMSRAWWRRVLRQLITFSLRLEALRVLHNDFWDANVLVTAAGRVTVVDYQYTHQYCESPSIRSPAVVSRRARDAPEKERLGWTGRWHSGGDLNQLLGLLANYPSFPEEYRSYIRAHVLVRPGTDFPYATTQSNPWFRPSGLLALWF